MKKILFFMVMLGILILAHSQIAQAQAAALEEDPSLEAATAQDLNNKICPVMGSKIIEGTKITYEYEGKIYHFCCPMCIDEFKKDPQKYIKKVEEELNAKSEKAVSPAYDMKGVEGMKM